MRWAVAVTVVVALVAGACGSDGEALGPSATVPQATTTTDPYAVPEVIDEAYVNRVLAGLDQAFGEVTRMIVRDRLLTPEAIARLEAIYVKDLVQPHIDLFQAELMTGLTGYFDEPGNQISTVSHLISVDRSCIFAQIERDYSHVGSQVDPRLSLQWMAIVSEVHSVHNPTSWKILYEGFPRSHTQPENPCI